MSALQNEIGKLKTLKESFSNLADSVANQKETNENILTLLSQFGESVLQEKVTVILNCQESIAWQDYAVNVTFEDGRTQAVPLSDNGTCSFSIKIGQNYSVQLPIIGTFIAPELKTYTAISSAREIYWSYVPTGIFGMDELGRRYSIAQIEALADKSIIKYGGYTDDYLENSIRDDGGVGNGFMWILGQETSSSKLEWASANVEFSQELLPYITTEDFAMPYCNGEAYTRYILSEGKRLNVDTPAATWCASNSIKIDERKLNGFLQSVTQFRRMIINLTSFKSLYNILGINSPTIDSNVWLTSCQYSETKCCRISSGKFHNHYNKNESQNVFLVFPLP